MCTFVCVRASTPTSSVLPAELRRVTELAAKVRTDSRRGHVAAAATGRVAFHIPQPVTQQHARHCPFGGSAEVATGEEPECDIFSFFLFDGRSAAVSEALEASGMNGDRGRL